MIGCAHNEERRILYHFTKEVVLRDLALKVRWRDRVAQAGDHLLLRCPYGCADLTVAIGRMS